MFGCLQVGPCADMALCCLVRRFIDSRPFRFSGGLGLGVYLAICLKPAPVNWKCAERSGCSSQALLPGYIVLSGPAIARGAMLIKNSVPVSTANRMRMYLIVFLLQGPVITMALVYLITV